ncbi:MAG: serine/threonine protein kinase [Myxococcales bacterium]|nr:serine/threonine protein kinase [Myxococcales bacterium]
MGEPPLGRVVDGRYRIERRIGAGGMGEVYAARQLNVDRMVALKLLHPDRIGDAKAVAQFLEEARAVGKLTGPHAVTLHDAGTMEDGSPYLAMELLEGMTLRDYLAAKDPPLDEIVSIVDAIALGLDEAHRRGIVHRDLKPANVFIAETPGHRAQVKILDFGLAHLVEEREPRARTAGTLLYMAPECLRGEPATARADVYALAIVAYEMLAGTHPFAGRSRAELLEAQLSEVPEPIDEIRDEPLPLAFVELLARSLAKPPRLRPLDAGAFRAALRAAFELPAERASKLPEVAPRGRAGDSTVMSEAVVSRTLPTQPGRASRGGMARWRPFLALAGVVTAAGLTLALRSGDDPEPALAASPPTPPPSAVVAVEVTISVESEPSGARLAVDGVAAGQTPTTLTVPQSETPIELRVEVEGHAPQTRVLVPLRDTSVVLQLASPDVSAVPSVPEATVPSSKPSPSVAPLPAPRVAAPKPSAVAAPSAAAVPSAANVDLQNRVHGYLD